MPNFNFVVSGGEHRFQAPAGGTISAGTFVKWSTGTIVDATDGAAIAGLAITDATAGEYITVVEEPVVVETGTAAQVDLTIGDVAYIASTTTVDAGAQGNISCGVVVNHEPTSAGRVQLDLHTSNQTRTTHA